MNPATVLVHWPGKSTPMCDKHAAQAVGLARTMGFNLTATHGVPFGVLCTNCVNEASKAAEVKHEPPTEV